MIDYENELNPAQLEAVTTLEGPVLVIAGAGSGKTRTITYRLARLVESGVPASGILLLTFTRKAAQQMVERARRLLHQAGTDVQAALAGVQGGTFHAYAFSVLRVFPPEGYGNGLTVMDGPDILAALQHCREELKAGKGDRSFPKNQTVAGLISKSRNKEIPLEDVVRRDAFHLMPHAEAMIAMAEAYAAHKKSRNLLDYDDLLFSLEQVLVANRTALDYCRRRHHYIMVDEYQDTNPVQARLAALAAGADPAVLHRGEGAGEAGRAAFAGNIMAVGDDAQSIYAFRGADVRNILHFPDLFPGTRLIRLEENYRSVQPVLDLSNAVLEHAGEGYAKHLFTRRQGGAKPRLVRPLSDRSQALLVAARIQELRRSFQPQDIAVLFRSGFHSYALEVALNKMGAPFHKYGGIRYSEAAHIKDVMSYARLVLNSLDFLAFSRMAELCKGVGAVTCRKIYALAVSGDKKGLEKALARHPELAVDLAFIDAARASHTSPAALISSIVEHYAPKLALLHPDDYPRRMQDLEQLALMASAYADLDLLVADLSLEDPVQAEERGPAVALSTIHSAKGLEWEAVIILDLVEERFPSRHSMARPEDFEEERRLLYVACTRAKQVLELYVPGSMHDRGSGGNVAALPSPFVRELSPELYAEWQEGYAGLVEKQRREPARSFPPARDPGRPAGVFAGERDATEEDDPEEAGDFADRGAGHSPGQAPGRAPALPPERCGYCTHKIFGRGKIVQFLPPDRYRVNFPGLGLKVIMADYLRMEE